MKCSVGNAVSEGYCTNTASLISLCVENTLKGGVSGAQRALNICVLIDGLTVAMTLELAGFPLF